MTDETVIPLEAQKNIPAAETFNFTDFLTDLNKRWNDKLLAAIPQAQLQETSAWIHAMDNPLFGREYRGTDVKEPLTFDEKQKLMYEAFSQRARIWGAMAEKSEGNDKAWAELQQRIAEVSAAAVSPETIGQEGTTKELLKLIPKLRDKTEPTVESVRADIAKIKEPYKKTGE